MSAKIKSIGRMRSTAKANTITYAAFGLLVLLVSGNTLSVSLVDRELPPFWGAGMRFAAASLIFFIIVAVKRYPLPRGRSLLGSILYGLLQFGISPALGYRALLHLPAGVFALILATGPILTLLFAVLTGIEPFRIQGLLGGLLAVAGIALIILDGDEFHIPLGSAMLALGMVVSLALSVVVVKAFPPVNNASMNAVGMAVGAPLLLLLSLLFHERPVLPADPVTWAAQLYLVLGSGIGLFMVLLFLLRRWRATAVSYQSVLNPVVIMLISTWFMGERPTPWAFVGGALVLVGVYLGALMPKWRVKTRRAVNPVPSVEAVPLMRARPVEVASVDGCLGIISEAGECLP